MVRYLDLGLSYKKHFESNKHSLDFLCEKLLKRKLCKYNQSLDWDFRPLRLYQLHYAALDAFILIRLLEEILKVDGFLVDNYLSLIEC